MRSPSLLVALIFLALSPGLVAKAFAQPGINIDNGNVTESNAGSADVVLTVTLTAAATGVVTVGFATQDQTAIGGASCGGNADYVTESGTVQFNPGQVSQPIGIAVCGDAVGESDEIFKVRLSNANGATIQDAEGRVTINNDDAAAQLPSLSINDATVVESGPLGVQTPMTFTVTLSPASSQTATVNFATSVAPPVTQNISCGQGTDLVTKQGGLALSPGQTTQTITVNICGDSDGESNEVFDVVLSNPTGATIADGTGRGTITNDDLPSPLIDDVSVLEGNGLASQVFVPVTLSGPAAEPLTVQFRVMATNFLPDAATSRPICTSPDVTVDFMNTFLDLQFLPGETAKSAAITICSDSQVEADEVFQIQVQRTAPLPLSPLDNAFVTIRNDDFIPTLTINDVTFLEGSAVSAGLTVSLSLPAPAAIQLTPTTAPHSTRIPRVAAATSGLACGGPADFRALVARFPIPAGATSVSIRVQICDDAVVEGLEGLSVTIQPVAGLTIGDGVGIIKITDND